MGQREYRSGHVEEVAAERPARSCFSRLFSRVDAPEFADVRQLLFLPVMTVNFAANALDPTHCASPENGPARQSKYPDDLSLIESP
jgi:hypothetical protein